MYPGLVNRKPSTTEVFFGFMVTIEFFYGLVIKQMLFLNKNYENFPYVFYNAEIHANRLRALSQFSLPPCNGVVQATVFIIIFCYDEQWYRNTLPPFPAIRCRMGTIFITLLKRIRFVTFFHVLTVAVFPLKIDAGKIVIACLMYCSFICLHAPSYFACCK